MITPSLPELERELRAALRTARLGPTLSIALSLILLFLGGLMLSDTTFPRLSPTPEAVAELNSRAIFALFLLGAIAAAAAHYFALGTWKSGTLKHSEAVVVSLAVVVLAQTAIVVWAFWRPLSDLNASAAFWPLLFVIGLGPTAAWFYLRKGHGNRLHGVNEVTIVRATLMEARHALGTHAELRRFHDGETVEPEVVALDKLLDDAVRELERNPTSVREIRDKASEYLAKAQTFLSIGVERARKPLGELVRSNAAEFLRLRGGVSPLGDLHRLSDNTELSSLRQRLAAMGNSGMPPPDEGAPLSLMEEGNHSIASFRQARHVQGELAGIDRALEDLKTAMATADFVAVTAECNAALDAIDGLRSTMGLDFGVALDTSTWREELTGLSHGGGLGLDRALGRLNDLRESIGEACGPVLIGLSASAHRELGFDDRRSDAARLLEALRRLHHKHGSAVAAKISEFIARFEEASLLLTDDDDRSQASPVNALNDVTEIATALTTRIAHWREGASQVAATLMRLESYLDSLENEATAEYQSQTSLLKDLTLPGSELIGVSYRGVVIRRSEVVAALMRLQTESLAQSQSSATLTG